METRPGNRDRLRLPQLPTRWENYLNGNIPAWLAEFQKTQKLPTRWEN